MSDVYSPSMRLSTESRVFVWSATAAIVLCKKKSVDEQGRGKHLFSQTYSSATLVTVMYQMEE